MQDNEKTMAESFMDFCEKEMGWTFIDVEVEDIKGNKNTIKTIDESGDRDAK